eukprot:31396-Pelagococcus_subviridis.AAC.4
MPARKDRDGRRRRGRVHVLVAHRALERLFRVVFVLVPQAFQEPRLRRRAAKVRLVRHSVHRVRRIFAVELPLVHDGVAQVLGHGVRESPERDLVLRADAYPRRRHREFVSRVQLLALLSRQRHRARELFPHLFEHLQVRRRGFRGRGVREPDLRDPRREVLEDRFRGRRRGLPRADVGGAARPAEPRASETHVSVHALRGEQDVLVRLEDDLAAAVLAPRPAARRVRIRVRIRVRGPVPTDEPRADSLAGVVEDVFRLTLRALPGGGHVLRVRLRRHPREVLDARGKPLAFLPHPIEIALERVSQSAHVAERRLAALPHPPQHAVEQPVDGRLPAVQNAEPPRRAARPGPRSGRAAPRARQRDGGARLVHLARRRGEPARALRDVFLPLRLRVRE